MDIATFTNRLVDAVKSGPVPSAGSIRSEADFEHRFVVEPAWQLASANPDIVLCVHPSKPRSSCRPNCDDAGRSGTRVRGCPECWASSKEWSVVKACGLRHTFDLVARDSSGGTLAVEVKWLKYAGGRGPNGEFQRFVGQCVLAAALHTNVVGVCGIDGARDRDLDDHTCRFRDALRSIGVRLVMVQSGA